MNQGNDILKEIMLHRQRVSLKMSTVANDIAANGRRHDNSYTGDVEYNLLEKIAKSDSVEEKVHYIELLDSIHAGANDYYPEFHDGIINMNMIQLLEYIADRIARIDASEVRPTTIDGYKREVIDSIRWSISEDLRGLIENTVEYFIDRNKSILKSLNKQVAMDGHQPALADATESRLNYGA